MKQKYYLIFGLLIIGILFMSGCTKKACTLEAKICTDGSNVGRNPDNNCEFDPCPTVEKEALLATRAPTVELEGTVMSLYLDELYEEGKLNPRDRASIRIDNINRSNDPNDVINLNIGEEWNIHFLYSARPAKLITDISPTCREGWVLKSGSCYSGETPQVGTDESGSVPGSTGEIPEVGTDESGSVPGSTGEIPEVGTDESETAVSSPSYEERPAEMVDGYIIYHLPKKAGVSETILPGVEEGNKIKITVWGGNIRGRSPNLYIEIGEYEITS